MDALYKLKTTTVKAPSSIITAVLAVIFSLKIKMPRRVDKRMVEMFWSGKNTALFIRPASIVFKRFAPPKQRPVMAG